MAKRINRENNEDLKRVLELLQEVEEIQSLWEKDDSAQGVFAGVYYKSAIERIDRILSKGISRELVDLYIVEKFGVFYKPRKFEGYPDEDGEAYQRYFDEDIMDDGELVPLKTGHYSNPPVFYLDINDCLVACSIKNEEVLRQGISSGRLCLHKKVDELRLLLHSHRRLAEMLEVETGTFRTVILPLFENDEGFTVWLYKVKDRHWESMSIKEEQIGKQYIFLTDSAFSYSQITMDEAKKQAVYEVKAGDVWHEQ